jgi:endonuclease I
VRPDPIQSSPRGTSRAVLFLVLALAAAQAAAAPPPGYYDPVDSSSVEAMRATLHAVIDDHVKIPYTASSTDTWDVLEIADQDPLDPARILDVYQNRSFPKYGGGNTDYNREHTWPNSYGFPDDGASNKPYSDCHHLFLCDIGYNSDRANRVYDDCLAGCQPRIADSYNGESGTNYFNSITPIGVWETWSGRRGDVARALLYLDVRYEGDAGEPDLILTDDVNLILASATGSNEPVAYMGILTTLLEWHAADPVDDKERTRNDAVFAFQGNRNPFIDHPEWVEDIFADGLVSDVPAAPPARSRIAAIHPNPFNPATVIELVLARPGRVRVQVFAVDGRLVRTLLDAWRETGPVRLSWDGRGEAPVASGSYFCRLQGTDGRDTRKLLLLK